MKRTNALTEGAMATALFAVLLAMAFYIPLLSILVVWLLPLPFIVFVVRNGFRSSLPLWFAAFVIAFLIGGFVALFYALMSASGGIVMGTMYRQRRSAFTVLLGGSLAYTAVSILIFIFTVAFLGFNEITYVVQHLVNEIGQFQQTAKSLGEKGHSFKMLKQSLEMMRYLAPALFVMIGVFYALITELIAAPVLKRLRLEQFVQSWMPFREWRFPRSFLWYYLFVLIIGFFQHFAKGSVWYIGYYNLLAILQLVILVQGFSFIFFYLHMKKTHRSVPILIVIAVLFFGILLSPLIEIVEIIGIIDLGFNLRERLRSGPKNGG